MAEDNAASLAERLDRIESRQAIAELVHAYARHIRQDMPELVPPLFTADGVFEIRSGHPDKPEYTRRSRVEGREALAAYYAQVKGRAHPVPLVHNLSITVDGDTATGDCVMEGQTYGAGGKVIGDYRDSFHRVDGRWLFAERIYTIFSAASTM